MPFTRATLLQLYAGFAAEQAEMREACEQIFSSSLVGKGCDKVARIHGLLCSNAERTSAALTLHETQPPLLQLRAHFSCDNVARLQGMLCSNAEMEAF